MTNFEKYIDAIAHDIEWSEGDSTCNLCRQSCDCAVSDGSCASIFKKWALEEAVEDEAKN